MELKKNELYGLRVQLAQALGIDEKDLDQYQLTLTRKESFPLDAEVKPACIKCKFYKEFNKQYYNEHSYIIQWCDLHNYGLSMWKCDKVGCTEFESKSV